MSQKVAGSINWGFRIIRSILKKEYWDRVFEYFAAEYRLDGHPNPKMSCVIKRNNLKHSELDCCATRALTALQRRATLRRW